MSKGGIIVIIIAIPASILALIQIWTWIAPNTARLKVLLKQDEVQIPAAYREYLRSVDRDRDGFVRVHDAAAAAASQQKNSLVGLPFQRPLEAMQAFKETAPIFGLTEPRIVTVKIVNVGRKPANDVKVFFPGEGFVEVTKDGSAVTSEHNKGWIWACPDFSDSK
jgi:hypothetical protein